MLELGVNFSKEFLTLVTKFLTVDNVETVLKFIQDSLKAIAFITIGG